MRKGKLTKRARKTTDPGETKKVATATETATIAVPTKPQPIPFTFDNRVSDLVLAAVGRGGELLSSDIEADVLAMNSRAGHRAIPNLKIDQVWEHIKHHVETGDILREEVYREGNRYIYTANPLSGGIVMARKNNPITEARARLAKNPSTDPRIPAVGSVITKQYKGEEHQVEVAADGFRLGGETFKSLTAVAKRITGYNAISGHQFFGLWTAPGKEPKAPKVEAPSAPAKAAKGPAKPKAKAKAAKGSRKPKAARTAKAKGKTSNKGARK